MEQTKTSNAVAVISKQNEVTQELLMDYLKQTHSNLMQNEMQQFIAIAMTFNLNPWKKEVYPIAYGQGNGRKLSIIVGYEVYLRRAEEFPQYDGYQTFFTDEGANMRCTCNVYRKDRNHETSATVYLREYTQNNSMWNTKPHVMLEKVAIATALRRAFPSVFNGMPYIADELPDEMTGRNDLNSKGYQEVVVEQNAHKPSEPTPEPPKEKHDPKDAKASLLSAVKTYNTKQFAAMLQMFANQDDEAHGYVVEKLKENGWSTPKMVPSDRYKDVVEWFYMAKDGGVVEENETAKEEVTENVVDTEEVPF